MIRLLPLLLPLTAFASLAEYKPMAESYFFQGRDWVISHVPQEHRLLLHTHLPGIFPVNFLCQRQGPSTTIVFPGDRIEAGAGDAEVKCSGGLTLKLRKDSRASVEEVDGKVALQLEEGLIELQPAGEPFSAKLGGAIFRSAGQQTEAKLVLARKGGEGLFLCAKGFFQVSVQPPTEAGSPTRLGSLFCRLSASLVPNPELEYFYAAEMVTLPDLAVERRLRPPADIYGVMEKLGVSKELHSEASMVVQLAPIPGSPNLFRFSWIKTDPFAKDCELFTQPTPRNAPVSAYKFTANFFKGDIKLQNEYRKHFLSLICRGPAGAMSVSQVVPPL